jgi:hypothetical protein
VHIPDTLLELDLRRKTAQRALAQAIKDEAPASDVHELTVAMHLAAKEFAWAMNKHEYEKQERHFAQMVLNSSTPRAAWQKLTKLLRPACLGLPVLVRDAAGKLLQSAAESTRVWHLFRAQVGADKSDSCLFDAPSMAALLEKERDIANTPPPTAAQDPILHAMNTDPIRESEVWAALKLCPNGSAAGLDHLPYEAYKYGGNQPVECLTLIFQLSWKLRLHPTQWDQALISPLFKGGPNRNNVHKYRAITLLAPQANYTRLYSCLV